MLLQSRHQCTLSINVLTPVRTPSLYQRTRDTSDTNTNLGSTKCAHPRISSDQTNLGDIQTPIPIQKTRILPLVVLATSHALLGPVGGSFRHLTSFTSMFTLWRAGTGKIRSVVLNLLAEKILDYHAAFLYHCG